MDSENIITIDGIQYYVLAKEEIDGSNYLYVGEIHEEDITGNFYVYKEEKDSYRKITNSDELKEILPVMINAMNE